MSKEQQQGPKKEGTDIEFDETQEFDNGSHTRNAVDSTMEIELDRSTSDATLDFEIPHDEFMESEVELHKSDVPLEQRPNRDIDLNQLNDDLLDDFFDD